MITQDMWLRERCPRCGGNLYCEEDIYKLEIVCLLCARHFDRSQLSDIITQSVKGGKAKMTELKEFTGISGIYSLRETARYFASTPPLTNGSSVHPGKLRYWISTSVPAVQGIDFPSRQQLITFLDLISMRMVVVLRSRGIPLAKIRDTATYLRTEFDIPFPLASKGLWTYGHNVYIRFQEHIITASKFGQQAMEFVNNWLKDVDLDMTFGTDELVNSWLVHQDVRINPAIQLGEPCIDGTRIPTSIIWSNYKAGDSIEVIARGRDLSPSLVDNAIQWEKRLVAT